MIAITNYSLIGPGYEFSMLPDIQKGQKLYQDKLADIFRTSSRELFREHSIGSVTIPVSPINITTAQINDEYLPRFVKIGELAFLGLGEPRELISHDTGYIISSSKGGLDILSEAALDNSLWQRYPQLFNYCHTDGLLNYLRDKYNLSGYMAANVNACSTGLDAVIQAIRWIEDGRCRRVIVGVSETNLIDVILAGFINMGVVADGISVPFSSNRSGFVPSEGAAFVVLEKVADSAGYPAISGWGQVNDAYHPTSFSPTNHSIETSMRQALGRAGLTPAEVGFVKAHGTGTELNDKIESEDIYRVFDSVPVSSYKSVLGHLLGTSGLFELAAMVHLLRNNIIPVTAGLTADNLDQSLPPLNYIHNIATPEYALTNAFGFGGSISSVVVRV